MRAQGIAAVAAAILIAGCGGGSAEDAGTPLICPTCPPPAPSGGNAPGSVEGYWIGTSGPYEFGAVVLPDGMTYVAYTRAGVVEGIMVGKTSADSQNFAGSVVDYNAPARAVTPTSISGTYARGASMTASAQVGSTTRSFTAAFDQTYSSAVDLAGLAGTWSGTGASRDGFTAGTLQLDAQGNFSGSTPLCSFTGKLTPVVAGKHPLRTTASFSGGRCPLAGVTIVGVAIVSEAGGRRQILTTGIAADQSDGFFGLLTKR